MFTGAKNLLSQNELSNIFQKIAKYDTGQKAILDQILVKGKNDISLGVCLIGRDYFTELQFSSLEEVLREWKFLYPGSKILGHRDTGNTSKTCPNFDVDIWCKDKNL